MKQMTAQEVSKLLREAAADHKQVRLPSGEIAPRPNNPVLLAMGKTKYLCEATACDLSFGKEHFEDSYVNGSLKSEPAVEDVLRARTGKFWTHTEDRKEVIFLDKQIKNKAPIDFEFSPFKYNPTPVNSESTSYLPAMQEVFLVVPNKNNKIFTSASDPVDTFAAMIDGGTIDNKTIDPSVRLDTWYEDCSFSMALPRQRKEIESMASSTNTMYAHVNPTYNFFLKEYEILTFESAVREQSLPSMYVMLSEMLFEPDSNKPQLSKNPWFEKHITLMNTMTLESAKAMTQPLNLREKFDIKATPVGQYFDMWSRQYPKMPLEDRSSLDNKFSNMIVTHSNVDILKSHNSKKELFPMYVDVEFCTDITTEFSQLLEDSGMSCVLMKNLIGRGFSSNKSFLGITEAAMQAGSDTGSSVEIEEFKPSRRAEYEERSVMDITSWFDNFSLIKTSGQGVSALDADNSIYLGSTDDVEKMSNDPKYSFYKSLMAVIFSSRVRQLAKDRTRSYREIMEGKHAHTETVLYRVEKRLGGPSGKFIQNFYLPNSNKIDVHHFVDTQVKYGHKYTYIIYAYELVFGTKYKYIDSWTELDTAGVVVHSEPLLQLVEVPYHLYTNRLMDSPPVPPDVDIIPFRGINNKLKMNFMSNVGRYDLMPEIIEKNELQQVKTLLASQDRFQDDPLRYESDDHAATFQVWRVETHPKNYRDFAGHMIQEVFTDVNEWTPQSATSASLIDKIKPNKKYWYTFRSVDIHGHVSYPTPIYQVEMVDDHGSVYPIIDVVDFAPETPKQHSISAKRILQIVPTLSQGVLNDEKSGLVGESSLMDRWRDDTFFLGVEKESLWGKKFKIRLTSKKTGRKMDLNVVFEHKHLKIEPE